MSDRSRRVDDGRFGELLRKLRKLQLRLMKDPKGEVDKESVEALQQTERWLREYVDPWMCPECAWTGKVPEMDSDPRFCPKCSGTKVFPYAYLEVERVSKQLSLLLQCATHYARKNNGHVAKKTLEQLGALQLDGSARVPQDVGCRAASRSAYGGQKKSQTSLFKKLKVWDRK